MAVDYTALRAQSPTKRDYRRRFDRDTARLRSQEQNRRTARAQSRAVVALQRAFPVEWRELYEAARAEVEAESGPLPGDEDGTA